MKGRKKVPTYWWDFEGDAIIVESDSDKYPVVGRFKFNYSDGPGCSEKAIEQAEELIGDLNAGRKTPKAQ